MDWKNIQKRVSNQYLSGGYHNKFNQPEMVFNTACGLFYVCWSGKNTSTGQKTIESALAELADCLNKQIAVEQKLESEAKTKRQKEFEDFWECADKVYIRFGKSPKSGKSWNYRDKHSECGVSAYAAVKTDDGYKIKPSLTFALNGGITERPAFLLDGEVIGEGTDGEPCLKVQREVSIKGVVLETAFGVVEAE